MNIRFINRVVRILLSRYNETRKLLEILFLFSDNGSAVAQSLIDWYNISATHALQGMEVHKAKDGKWEVIYTFKEW